MQAAASHQEPPTESTEQEHSGSRVVVCRAGAAAVVVRQSEHTDASVRSAREERGEAGTGADTQEARGAACGKAGT